MNDIIFWVYFIVVLFIGTVVKFLPLVIAIYRESELVIYILIGSIVCGFPLDAVLNHEKEIIWFWMFLMFMAIFSDKIKK